MPDRIIGGVDRADHAGLAGWACNLDTPNQPLSLSVWVDARPVCQVIADQARPAGPSGFAPLPRCGFTVRWPCRLDPEQWHDILVRAGANGPSIQSCPVLLGPVLPVAMLAPALDALCAAAIADDAAATDASADASASMLDEMMHRLYRLRSSLHMNDGARL